MAAPAGMDKGVDAFREALLGWYDRHRRTLPWRALPGQAADPYHVWLSEIMLQQTTVGAVVPYFQKFIRLWPDVRALAEAPEQDVMAAWAGLGYYSRARNLHKCAKIVADGLKGRFPDHQDGLKALPGIGDYTSAAITAIAFDKPATVIDGNVERVVARYFAIQETLPAAKKPIREKAGLLSNGRADRPGDFAQAMMDLGATVCIPKNPRCSLCPVSEGCEARKLNIQNDLPRRAVKKIRPKKTGYIYWITSKAGQVLLHRRPPEGLLGGMTALPTSEWLENDLAATLTHPADIIDNVKVFSACEGRDVHHVFTHFELKLLPFSGEWKAAMLPYGYYWADPVDFRNWGLPTVFRKAAVMMIEGVL
jgi:A/G-specific adenine glycosylase